MKLVVTVCELVSTTSKPCNKWAMPSKQNLVFSGERLGLKGTPQSLLLLTGCVFFVDISKTHFNFFGQ